MLENCNAPKNIDKFPNSAHKLKVLYGVCVHVRACLRACSMSFKPIL